MNIFKYPLLEYFFMEICKDFFVREILYSTTSRQQMATHYQTFLNIIILSDENTLFIKKYIQDMDKKYKIDFTILEYKEDEIQHDTRFGTIPYTKPQAVRLPKNKK